MIKDKCTMSVRKMKKGIIITSSEGFHWETKTNAVEIAITNVLAHTLVQAFEYENMLSAQFKVEIRVTRKDDEQENS